jgi:hypothetical protein
MRWIVPATPDGRARDRREGSCSAQTPRGRRRMSEHSGLVGLLEDDDVGLAPVVAGGVAEQPRADAVPTRDERLDDAREDRFVSRPRCPSRATIRAKI